MLKMFSIMHFPSCSHDLPRLTFFTANLYFNSDCSIKAFNYKLTALLDSIDCTKDLTLKLLLMVLESIDLFQGIKLHTNML